jgi:tRNA(fMet)-specific endonuclease VapC
MLDTDISSYIIKRRPATLAEKFEKYAETLNLSVITAAELRFGAEEAGRPKLTELVEAYLERLAILDWTNEVTTHHARIRSELERSGKPIGNMDLLIAAHAVPRDDAITRRSSCGISSLYFTGTPNQWVTIPSIVEPPGNPLRNRASSSPWIAGSGGLGSALAHNCHTRAA